jgi:hypothetical protein
MVVGMVLKSMKEACVPQSGLPNVNGNKASFEQDVDTYLLSKVSNAGAFEVRNLAIQLALIPLSGPAPLNFATGPSKTIVPDNRHSHSCNDTAETISTA